MTIVFQKTGLTLGDYGLFWSEILAEFPASETGAPIPAEIEQFDGFRVVEPKIELLGGNVLPRALYRNPEKGELIQLQPDRFSFNWLKANDEDTYPHSEAVLARFFDLLNVYTEFARRRGLGEIIPVQCEITNVNIIPMSDIGNCFVDFATVVRLTELQAPENLLQLESQISGAKHLILDDGGQPIGRVHSIGQPALSAPTKELVYRLDITARGAPIGSGLSGVERFFEKAVSAVNGVFLASVTQSGRQFWGEKNG